MSDSTYKHKYQKYKLRVKTWERDFKRKFSRVPSKVRSKHEIKSENMFAYITFLF